MSITKRFETTVSVDARGYINLLTTTIVEDGGKELGRSNHREVIAPGDSIDGKPADVLAIAAAVWTPEKIAAARVTVNP